MARRRLGARQLFHITVRTRDGHRVVYVDARGRGYVAQALVDALVCRVVVIVVVATMVVAVGMCWFLCVGASERRVGDGRVRVRVGVHVEHVRLVDELLARRGASHQVAARLALVGVHGRLKVVRGLDERQRVQLARVLLQVLLLLLLLLLSDVEVLVALTDVVVVGRGDVAL